MLSPNFSIYFKAKENFSEYFHGVPGVSTLHIVLVTWDKAPDIHSLAHGFNPWLGGSRTEMAWPGKAAHLLAVRRVREKSQ